MMKVNALSLNHTKYYNIREEHKPLIKEIRSVFAYNPESGTYLCEIVPSYELNYLHTYIVYDGEVTDNQREELDNYYCYEQNDDTYMHCSDVRQFVKDHPDYHRECQQEFDDMEEAREYLNGNWPF